ncbi:MAG: DEAD/DEAH box helicase [Ichthyobacteriaceae bacterium]|nr:DEAD/DEAH box helicase [Ichthyobacteriaceae bacterium]
MLFKELNITAPLINALDDLGYKECTPIQEKAFPVVMSGNDMVGVAQTGTGKTFAYLLPILRQMKFSKDPHPKPRVLIVQPTRELVIQVAEEINKLTKYMNLHVGAIYGGANINKQKDLVYNGLDILVSTPGRLVDMTSTGILRLNNVHQFVLDEVDEMLNSGFRHQITNILEMLPKKRQNIMFSATLNRDVANLIEVYFNSPERVEIARHGTPLENISQSAYMVPNYYTKVNLLKNLLHNSDELTKVVVFVARKRWADRLYDFLLEEFDEEEIDVLHSNKSQNYRIQAIQKFEQGEYRILIATDVIARGIDVDDITHVISFDTPDYPENYIHRIGRTGRAEKKGKSIALVSKIETEYLEDIEEMMQYEVPKIDIPRDVEISEQLLEAEKENTNQQNYIGNLKDREGRGDAFHEKKAKNQKENLGGPGRRKPKKTRPINRAAQRKRSQKSKK